ncbi:MAG: hypothetical protein WC989_07300 [Micavibrio sp.]
MLFYILAAIALIGFLIVAIRGGGQEGANINTERDNVLVNQVRSYAGELERAAGAILRAGFSEADLRFAHPYGDAAHAAYGSISDNPRRQIFALEGGAATWREPPEDIQTHSAPWVFTGSNRVNQIGTDASDPRSSELVAILPNITKGACLQINRVTSVKNPDGEPPKEDGSISLSPLFTGTYTNAQVIGATGNHLHGVREGCFEGNTGSDATGRTGRYYYYRVLLAR